MDLRFAVFRSIARCCSLFLLLSVSACEDPQEPLLRIGTNIWPGYEHLYLARSLGFYEQSEIKLVEMTSAPDVINALRNGALEGGALTLDEVLSLIDDGIALKVILVMDFSEGGDVLLVKPGIDSLAALRGKYIAVENTAVGAILLDGALKAADLSVSDVNIISCSHSEHIKCYQSADAVVTYGPTRSKLLKLGAQLLFDSSQIPGRIVDVLAVHAETVKTNPNALKKLLTGYFKAHDYFFASPESAANLMSPRLQLSPVEVLASYAGINLTGLEGNRTLLNGKPSPLQLTADDIRRLMLQNKFLKNKFSVEGLIDNSFLPESDAR